MVLCVNADRKFRRAMIRLCGLIADKSTNFKLSKSIDTVACD